MFVVKPYDRLHAQEYAQRFALRRNALFPDYEAIGGDCTNFVSQCIYAGSCEMNFTPTFGWYYISPSERAPAWTGVQYLYNFLTQNGAQGPFGKEVRAVEAELGDIIQLGNRTVGFYHSLIITGFEHGTFLVCAHSDDALNRPLNSYEYQRIRFLHIEGVRFEMPSVDSCFLDLMNEQGNMAEEPQQTPMPPQELQPETEEEAPILPPAYALQLEPEMEYEEALEDNDS